MRVWELRAGVVLALLACACVASGCGALAPKYEYEEEIYLRLDGSATVNVNASVASLVALRGADLPLDPTARLDRGQVRALFEVPGASAPRLTLSRRDGRRFVHVGIDVPDVGRLQRAAIFSWSTYQFDRQRDQVIYRQRIGAAAAKSVGAVGWTGRERVVFKMHIPSEIPYHNAPSRQTERGNILRWEQPLVDRLKGEPIDVEVRMEPESILYTTLLLFGLAIVAVAMTFGAVIWWVARRGRTADELARPA